MKEFGTPTHEVNAEKVPRVQMHGGSVIGEKDGHYVNDDSWFTDPAHGTLGVFDGVGGAPGSFAASQVASRETKRRLAELDDMHDVATVTDGLSEALVAAHESIREMHNGTMTTAVLAKIFEADDGNTHAVIESTGDSRGYLLREGELMMLTLDHGCDADQFPEDELWRMQTKLAAINDDNYEELVENDGLLKEAFHFRNIISSALGDRQDIKIYTRDIVLQTGDRLLLTTDGIHDNLTLEEMRSIMASEADDAALVTSLLEWAQTSSREDRREHIRAKPDDMTAAVATIT